MKTERESNFRKWLRADCVEKTERECPECGGSGRDGQTGIFGKIQPVNCENCNGSGKIKEKAGGAE